jgi:hypothetical protein
MGAQGAVSDRVNGEKKVWLLPLFFPKNLAFILESFRYDFTSPIVNSSSLEQIHMCKNKTT